MEYWTNGQKRNPCAEFLNFCRYNPPQLAASEDRIVDKVGYVTDIAVYLNTVPRAVIGDNRQAFVAA